MSSNHDSADFVNLLRTISRNDWSVESSSASMMFLMLFKNRSALSDGYPEKVGKTSYRAFRSRATSTEAAIEMVFWLLPVVVCVEYFRVNSSLSGEFGSSSAAWLLLDCVVAAFGFSCLFRAQSFGLVIIV